MSNIEYFYDVVQGTDEWLRLKHGVLSASLLRQVITPKNLTLSSAQTTKLFFDDLLSQRVDDTLPDNFVSYAMQRGLDDEPYAVQQYAREYNAEYKYCGFIINHSLGFPLGLSPDTLIGADGLLEIKSREPKYQVQTILNHIAGRTDEIIPSEFMLQVQTSLFVSERDWCDFISFCNGFPMVTIRVEPDPIFQEAISDAAIAVERILRKNQQDYEKALNDPRLTPTERREINVGEMV